MYEIQGVTENWENVPAVLRAFKKAYGWTNKDIAERLEWTEPRVQQKLSGSTRCDAEELDAFARLYGVRVGVFFLTPDEAIDCAVKHFDLRVRWSCCDLEVAAHHVYERAS